MRLVRPILYGFLLVLLANIGYYFLCLNHVSINEIGVAYDSRNGSIAVQHPGWHITHPLVRATTITLLPLRVDGPYQTSARGVINVKLVRFRPERIEDFIKTQGFQYMGGYCEKSIFAGYAFSGKEYSFLEILQ